MKLSIKNLRGRLNIGVTGKTGAPGIGLSLSYLISLKDFAMSTPTNPSFDVAHLGHVEIYSDKFDDSLDFFKRVYGLKLSAMDEHSAYLQIWMITNSAR